MKGFILKSHEAQALAAGKPVVIWRVCKPQPECYSHDNWPNDPVFRVHFNADQSVCCAVCMGKNQRLKGKGVTGIRNPFPVGVPLFGKETWDGCEVDVIRYKADGGPAYNDNGRGVASWKPSVHMPEWASRITLSLSDVKVRRPQDADEADILASGIEKCPKREGLPQYYTFPGGIMDHDPVQVLMYLIKAQMSNLYHFTALATPQPKNS